jgi:hypothetical protein
MAMRDADKDRRKNRPIKNSYSPANEAVSTHELKQLLMTARAQRDQWQKKAKDNEEAASRLTEVEKEIDELKERAAQTYQIYLNEQKNYQQALVLYNEEQTRATQLVAQRDEWQQRAIVNEKAVSQLVHVQQDIETYQVQMKELQKRAELNFQKYLDEQKNSQQVLHNYNQSKAKTAELITQRNELQQRAEENQKAAYELIQVRLDLQTYQVKVSDLEESAAQNYQKYLDEQKNYQEALALYNEEKARANELLVQYEKVSSERDNYLTLYNEAQTQLKFERRSKASIKGWETRRKAENARLKQEIADMVVLLRDSLASKDEAINNLYVVAERMDRIQSLVDSVEEDTTSNPVGLVQKFKRIWSAIKEILSE